MLNYKSSPKETGNIMLYMVTVLFLETIHQTILSILTTIHALTFTQLFSFRRIDTITKTKYLLRNKIRCLQVLFFCSNLLTHNCP